MPLAPLALPSDVRLLFGESIELPEGGDDLLERLIEIASDEVREVTRRMFSTRELGVTRLYPVSKSGTVYVDELLSADDVISISSPLGAVEDQYYTVSPEGYPVRGSYLYLERISWPAWEDIPPEHLNFFTTELHGLVGNESVFDFRGQRLSITANFGYTQIPRTVRHLVARTVATWYKQDIDTGGRGGNEGDNTLTLIEPTNILPPVIEATLRRTWQRPEVVV